MKADLMTRVEAAAKQLRSRAEDLYKEDKWPDGDLMNEVAVLLDEVTVPSHLEHTQGV
jgi:hypothetical protein